MRLFSREEEVRRNLVPVILLDDMSGIHAIGKGCKGDERMLEAVNVSHQYQC